MIPKGDPRGQNNIESGTRGQNNTEKRGWTKQYREGGSVDKAKPYAFKRIEIGVHQENTISD